MFDTPEDIHLTLATQAEIEVHTFDDLISEGSNLPDCNREEPKGDSVLVLGITSGTTGQPKLAMLTHVNFISG